MSALDEMMKRFGHFDEIEMCIQYTSQSRFQKNIAEQAATELAQLREANQMLRQAEANYDTLQTPMPCGHLARYATTNESGTQFCVWCAWLDSLGN